jgi:hypothetical protein
VKKPQVLADQEEVLVAGPLNKAQSELLGKVIMDLRHILVRIILAEEVGEQEQ